MSDFAFKTKSARQGALAKRVRGALALLALIAAAIALAVWALFPIMF